MIKYQIYQGVMMFLNIMNTLLIVYWVLSLFHPNFKAYYLLENFMAPLLRPFRILNMKLMAKMRGGMMIDFSIWMAIIAIRILQGAVTALFFRMFY